jgi:hypothetical protein
VVTRDYYQLLAYRFSHQEKKLAAKDARATKSRAEVKTGYHTVAQKIRAADDRAMRDDYINSAKGHVLGGKWMHYDAKRKPTFHHMTGRNRKFISEISPGRFDMRTSWGKARHSSGFHKILKPRKKKLLHLKDWRKSGNFIIPK